MTLFDDIGAGPIDAVVIPVVVEKGKIRARDGGPVPRMIEGAFGHLVMPKASMIFRKQDLIIEALPAETSLLVAVRHDKVPQNLLASLYHAAPKSIRTEWPSLPSQSDLFSEPGPFIYRAHSFVVLELLEPLRIQFSLKGPGTLLEARCRIPCLELEQDPISVNQAYTSISEKFEPHRAAHTGNVFNRVYCLLDAGWTPLDFLRTRLNKEYEQLNASGSRAIKKASQ